MVAILADQHLGQQRRRRQAAGDRPLRRGSLNDAVAGAAGVFRPGDAQHSKLCGNPVQHLADALADAVLATAATRTDLARHIDHHRLARQLVGQRLAAWPCSFVLRDDRRTAGLNAADVGIQFLQAEERTGRDRGARSGGRTARVAAV